MQNGSQDPTSEMVCHIRMPGQRTWQLGTMLAIHPRGVSLAWSTNGSSKWRMAEASGDAPCQSRGVSSKAHSLQTSRSGNCSLPNSSAALRTHTTQTRTLPLYLSTPFKLSIHPAEMSAWPPQTGLHRAPPPAWLGLTAASPGAWPGSAHPPSSSTMLPPAWSPPSAGRC